MQKSDTISALAAALAKAQAAIRPAKKDSTNPHYKSKYADLASIMEACRDALAANDLSVVQMPVDIIPGHASLETVLLHKSGEWMSSVASCRLSKDDAQGYGSAITYLRRYCLAAMLAIAQDDDDGESAAAAKQLTPHQAPRKGSNDLGVLRDALIQRLRALRAIENECIGHAPEFVLDGKIGWSMQIVQLNTEIAASRARLATWSNVETDDLSDDDLRDAAIARAAESAADDVPADI